MDLNLPVFFVIALLPIVFGGLWYRSNKVREFFDQPDINMNVGTVTLLLLYGMSVLILFGFMNVIIHQIGFYELFFTDIVQGNEESKRVASDFLSKYGQKHRHFGHGVFHGIINAFSFVGPVIGYFAIIYRKRFKYFVYHFLFWLITCAITGGLIAALV